ncbi:hypothetical protein SAMN04488030_1335 [Aliiroseovarius halocynthiae]|nr:hypothetical protein SAMN04488030_1335 [Aliiroseovarius halocynthiae]
MTKHGQDSRVCNLCAALNLTISHGSNTILNICFRSPDRVSGSLVSARLWQMVDRAKVSCWFTTIDPGHMRPPAPKGKYASRPAPCQFKKRIGLSQCAGFRCTRSSLTVQQIRSRSETIVFIGFVALGGDKSKMIALFHKLFNSLDIIHNNVDNTTRCPYKE